MGRRILNLHSDSFGGRGGIAAYNRSLLRAVCAHAQVDEVVALPRLVQHGLEDMPSNLRFEASAAGGKLRYAAAVLALAARPGSADLVICSHLNLLPFARFLGARFHCPILPVVYGRDAWEPTTSGLVNALCRQIGAFVSIRKMTANRLKSWAGIPDAVFHYLPNCIEAGQFGLAPRRADLVAKYGLGGRTVVMTAGRIESAAYEPNKGFDEVMETLPLLAREIPDITYLVMGDGDGQPALADKSKSLGVADRVVFTGYVSHHDKADHYRLADVVAMPGSSPNFDRYPFRFAFLEPLACGVPVVGSRLEDASEKDDPDAKQLLVQVDPSDRNDIKRGIVEALAKPRPYIDPLLSKFSYDVFRDTTFAILDKTMRKR